MWAKTAVEAWGVRPRRQLVTALPVFRPTTELSSALSRALVDLPLRDPTMSFGVMLFLVAAAPVSSSDYTYVGCYGDMSGDGRVFLVSTVLPSNDPPVSARSPTPRPGHCPEIRDLEGLSGPVCKNLLTRSERKPNPTPTLVRCLSAPTTLATAPSPSSRAAPPTVRASTHRTSVFSTASSVGAEARTPS